MEKNQDIKENVKSSSKYSGVEDFWMDVLSSRHYPDVWMEAFAFAPPNWRPDKRLTQGLKGQAQSYLATHWMMKHTEAWQPLFEFIVKSFPDLSKEAFVESTFAGLSQSEFTRANPFKSTCSERLMNFWIQSGKHHWEKDQPLKEAFLAQAVEMDLLEIATYMVAEGATVQLALPLVMSKSMLEMLLKNGASPDQVLEEDLRHNEAVACDGSHIHQTHQEWVGKKTAMEHLQYAGKMYASTQERDKVMSRLNGIGLQQASEEERKQKFFETIKNDNRRKSLNVVIRQCTPECFGWRIEHQGESLNVAMWVALCDKARDVDEFFWKKMPKELIEERLPSRKNALEFLIQSGLNKSSYARKLSNLFGTEELSKKMYAEGLEDIQKMRLAIHHGFHEWTADASDTLGIKNFWETWESLDASSRKMAMKVSYPNPLSNKNELNGWMGLMEKRLKEGAKEHEKDLIVAVLSRWLVYSVGDVGKELEVLSVDYLWRRPQDLSFEKVGQNIAENLKKWVALGVDVHAIWTRYQESGRGTFNIVQNLNLRKDEFKIVDAVVRSNLDAQRLKDYVGMEPSEKKQSRKAL